jgi:PAS domain S-box-containing protein
MQQWLEACGAGKSPDDLDFRTTLSDGSVRFICVSGDMIFDAENKPFFMAGTMCDITDRKRTEEALRESETRYRSVLQSATDAIVTVDSSGIIIGWNNAAERIFGYRYTEAVGQPLTSIVSLYHHDENSNGMKGLQTEGGQNALGRTVEFKGFRKDKSVFPIELSLSSWETKSGRFFTGIIRDITERKQMEESLLTSEIRYRTFFENSMDAILLENSDGKIFSANQASCAMFGYLEEELINLGRSGIMDIADPRLLAFVSERALKGKARGELTLIRKDGTRFPSEISSAIFENREGQANTSIVIHDITERKKMEEGLRQMQKLEGLGTLAGGIAHDFNNILGIILAYNSNIKKFKDDSKKLDLATETITKAVDRGRTLVQQILMFARKTETSFSAVNVNDVVMEVVIMIYEMFPKNVTCSQNFDKSIHYINADRSQLHQVLMNLCVNARDAMPKGGVLSISTHMESVTSLRNQHPGASESSYICIEVSDTGEGMTSETQKRIFEPFFTTKGIGKGTGLGLSVTFGVIQTHKGFIDVESELGKGTTFRVYLPASRVAEPIRETQEKALEEMPGGTETLLIVEDEEMLLMSLQMVLVDKGYKVLSVQDGFKALKIYQENKNKIALVITDLGLPNISGLEVCQQIKKINPKERIILATGYLDPEMKTEFLKAGIQHFLYKPYDLTKVLKEVRDVLDEK